MKMKKRAAVTKMVPAQAYLFLGLGVVNLVLIVLAITLMNHSTVQLVTNYLTNNPLASQAKTVFAPATHVLWNIQLRWVLIVILAIPVIRTVARVIVARGEKPKSAKFKANEATAYKWQRIDTSLTATLMLLVIANLNGLQDSLSLVVVAGLSLISYKLAHIAITAGKNGQEKLARKTFQLSVISAILPWLLILVYVIGTLSYGGIRSPWYIYGLDLVGLSTLIKHLTGYSFTLKEESTHRKMPIMNLYWLVDPASKIAFSLVLIIGFYR
jgi:hypothetical protein